MDHEPHDSGVAIQPQADGVDEVFGSLVAIVWSRSEQRALHAPVVLRTTDTGHS
ncbi:hypothetical protein OG930_45255 [Streptomyces sp. NBC_01799]|uniref:hypothetical protein n=1 Tax=Streptomyces sp. NBC_01800 TaxID=2975945 RepID=UPI002DD96C0D|nr:hypothetical protein [Streptomyces sp. NBC_01800]WSA65596.1 hypothetical protein OIE65_00215 [Streptomyces sp. NBC_01800]WSA73521.1 hypothetical protein OIE65_45845 [Streptomyces sp. NBC_01800]WSA74209.1 hypothetical protein OG930_00205 [Streptomyces sp. NBC_01799]WSA82038.1 hypothetical protein OG930_45255 [Streptomyces sp. NBC_01799]